MPLPLIRRSASLLPSCLCLGILGGLGCLPAAAYSPGIDLYSGTATVSGSGTVVDGKATYLYNAGPYTTNYGFVDVYNNSVFNLEDGGTIYGLDADGTSTVNLYGGTCPSGYFAALDSATLNVYGGSFDNVATGYAPAGQQGTVNIFGGTIIADETLGPGNTNISGGTIGTIEGYYEPSLYTITGGSIGTLQDYAGVYNISGGSIGLITSNSRVSTVDIFGSDLFLHHDGEITGVLQDGETINTLYSGWDYLLEFNGVRQGPPPVVPEASTFGSLGVLLVGGTVLVFRARRRRTA